MTFRDLKIKVRLQLILGIIFISFVIFIFTILSQFKSSLLEQKYALTKNVVESAYSVLLHFKKQSDSGEISKEKAQTLAKNAVKDLRYQGGNYFWINDLTPTMIMHPIKPKLDGKNLSSVKDPNGTFLFNEFVKKVKAQGSGFVPYLWPKPGFDKPVKKISYVKKLPDWNWIIGSGVYLDDVDSEFSKMAIEIIAIGGGLFIIISLLVLYIQRSILIPLNATAIALEDIGAGEGDLTKRLSVKGNDELTQLAKAFNRFSEKIAVLIQNVHQNADQVTANANSLAEINQNAKTLATEENEQTHQLENAMEQMKVTINEIAQNAESASLETVQGQQLVSDGQEVINQTVTEINSLTNTVQEATTVITSLAVESENIGGVLDVIRGIADQTNLLALNAAIEAARAGEQGRGFAVVADEVRTLASRTGQSTEEIQTMIQKLQQGANSAVNVIESSSRQAKKTTDHIQQANNSLNKISVVIDHINEMNTQVATAAEQQSLSADEINRNAHRISNLSQDSLQGIEAAVKNSEELRSMGKNLSAQLNQFKVS
ncbi:MAG: methyl-accepting chemotaxis protein [Alteromonadaceae bacterium]|nr:methyl-accepting chemotaxis protein [Alteromonadaceae bacterium]